MEVRIPTCAKLRYSPPEFQETCFTKRSPKSCPQERSEMKNFWLLVAVAGLLSMMSPAQTVNGSASGNATVSAQANAGAKSSQNAQAAGASANANASAQGQVNTEHKARHESDSKAGAGSGTTTSGAGGRGTGASGVLASGTTLNAELTHSVDAKSCKPGDQVTAKLTEDVKSDGKVVVHKGSKLVGHVTEAQARGKGNADSRLGIVFDKAVLQSGEELSFNGALQAVAPPVNATLSAAGDESSSIGATGPMSGGSARRSGGGGGLLGGATSAVGGATSTATGALGGATGTVTSATTGAVNGTSGLAGGLTAQGRLTNASQGAIALQGLTLSSATAGSAQSSVVSSTTRNVRLDSGTQMLLKVTGSAQ